MEIDPAKVAEAALNTVYFSGGQATISIDIGFWNAQQVKELFDALLSDMARYKQRLRGVRTDTAGFAKLGIVQDTANSGLYKSIPVVMTPSVGFDIMEFVLQPIP